jgi:hypothetical protein
MGGGSYSSVSRSNRARESGFYDKSRDDIFTQSYERKAHKDMTSRGVQVRECRDNDDHPNTVPVQVYLDVTGSMGHIPHMLIKDGLPTLVSRLLENVSPDITLMFGAIGDHECDREPLQVGQFEASDEAMDMWLTRTYLEGRGGGNGGESYPLAWYFAGNHVVTDAFEKRGQKGFVFTIGDELFLNNYPKTALQEVMGDANQAESNLTAAELYAAACKQNHVFHIFIEHGSRRVHMAWKDLLGDNLIVIQGHESLPNVISEAIINTKGLAIAKPKKTVDESGVGVKPVITDSVTKITL